MIYKNRHYIFYAIILLGLILRFYKLGSIPVGLHRDEAFLGYEAYSLYKTARTITGDFLPLHSKAFLFSPIIYSYISILPIAIFSLNSFSVRFVSALSGILTVFATYYFALLIFSKHKNKYMIALMSSFLLAICPWHINLSRVATENSLAVLFILLATILFIKWSDSARLKYLISSMILFTASIYTYQGPRSFLPLFLPILVTAIYKKGFTKNFIISAAFYFMFIILPVALILVNPVLNTRIRTLGLNSDKGVQLVINELITEDSVLEIKGLKSRIFHNKINGYASKFLQNYMSHFSYDFLFTDRGFPDRFRIPATGILLVSDLLLLPVGIYFLINTRTNITLFLIGWVLIAPIGSSLAFDDVPNLQRTMLIFPALSIISAYGFTKIIKTKTKLTQAISVIISILLVLNFVFYLHQYYVHQITHQPYYRQEGYQKLVDNLSGLENNYKKIVITNRESAPSIFVLFYKRYNPEKLQEETKGFNVNDFDSIKFSKYEFSREECPLRLIKNARGKPVPSGKPGILYVNYFTCEDFPDMTVLSTVKRSDNSDIFKIATLNQ